MSKQEPPVFLCVRSVPNNPTMSFQCPTCGKVNHHGVGEGHRVSHCECWRGVGYYLKEAMPTPEYRRKLKRTGR